MDVPDLGGSGMSLGTLLLILAIALIGVPLVASVKETLEARARSEASPEDLLYGR